jgi:raffinose/stachyose/melibiose transport system permease protein
VTSSNSFDAMPRVLKRGAVAAYFTPALTVYSVFVLWPIVQTVWLALQRWNGYGPQTFIGLQNFTNLLADPIFRIALRNSLLWDLGAAVGVTVVGLGLALLIRSTGFLRVPVTAVFLPILLPPVAVASIWILVYSPLSGGLNTLLRSVDLATLSRDWLGDPHLALPALFVALAWSALGIGTLAFLFALQNIEREYVDLSLVEGAGSLWRFLHVSLPAVRRTAAVVALVNAALAAQVFDLVFVKTGGGPGYATMLLPVDTYGRAFGGRTGQGAAVGLIQLVIGLVLAAIAVLLTKSGSESTISAQHDGSRRVNGCPRLAAFTLLTAFLAIMLAPLFWLLASAFGSRSALIGVGTPSANPFHWRWGALESAWNAGMGGAIETSLFLGIVVAVVTVLLVAPAGFAIAHLITDRRLKAILGTLLIVGLFEPTVVLIVPLFSLLHRLGLLDSAAGVLLPEIARAVPFGVLLLWVFLSQLPKELLETAEIDGAGSFQRMFHVALPLVRPALTIVGVWTFATSWNEYLLPTVVSQDGSLQTVPTVLAGFIGRSDTEYSLLAAGCLLATVPAVLALVGLQARAVFRPRRLRM